EQILDAITAWMAVNSEAIYATRPWKIYGTSRFPLAAPSATASSASADSKFNEKNRKDLTADDLRFTTKGKTLYVFAMGWPEGRFVVAPLATSGPHSVGKITNVELLGSRANISFTHDQQGLTIQPPTERPCDHAVVFKVTGAIGA